MRGKGCRVQKAPGVIAMALMSLAIPGFRV